MARYEKGILGVRKDSKKKILLSFGVGKGSEEWPSDDTEDSDYEPCGFEPEVKQKSNKKKRKRVAQSIISSDEDSDYEPENGKKNITKQKLHSPEKKSKQSSEKLKKQSQKVKEKKSKPESNTHENKKFRHKAHGSNIASRSINSPGNIWGAHIPPEVLTKIFMYVVDQNGSLPFLIRACRVCQLWNAVASDLELWKVVDLSFGWIKKSDRWLNWLCDNKLGQVRTLDLSGWEKVVKDDQVMYLTEKCPHLEEISLRGCTKISGESLHNLVCCCEKLQSLDLSHHENQQNSRIKADFTMAKHLNTLMDKMGNRLRKLNLSNHSLANFNAVLKTISQHCGSLRELDLSGVKFSSDYLTVDIEALQAGCPKLTALRLNCAMIRPTPSPQHVENDVGWDDLEELQIGTWNQLYTGVPEGTLQRLLKSSRRLRLLNIRGCKSVLASAISQLCCTDLEQLYMTWTKVPTSAGIEDIFRKWNHSLQDLDVGWCRAYSDHFSLHLAALSHPNSKLHTLDLSGSTVNMKALRGLLSGCQRISTLAVSSCRSLEPCYKRRYTQPKEMLELRKKLKI